MKSGSFRLFLLSSVLLVSSTTVRADDVTELRGQVSTLMKRLNELEKKQKHLSVSEAQYQLNNEKKIKSIETENLRLKEDHEALKKDSATKGPEKGTFYIPGTKTAIGIYGYAKAEFINENKPIGGDNSDPSYQSNFSDIVLDGAQQNVSGPQRAFTARESRFGFKTVTLTDFGSIMSKIEADFYGGGADNTYLPRLRHAWIGLKAGRHEVIVGQTDSVFGDDNGSTNDAMLLDFGGIAGSAGGRTPMIRYSYQASPTWKIILGLEEPDIRYWKKTDANPTGTPQIVVSTFNSSTKLNNVLNRLPALTGQIRYETENYHVALRGILQQVHLMSKAVDSKADPYDIKEIAHALGLSGHYSFNDANKLMLEANYGSGMSSFTVGSSGFILDVSTPQAKSNVQKTLGLSAAFEHKWSEKWKSTFAAGYLRVFNKDFMTSPKLSGPDLPTAVNRWIQSIHTNLVYEPVKDVFLIGVEYAYGKRRVENPLYYSTTNSSSSTKGDVHRFEIAAKYMF